MLELLQQQGLACGTTAVFALVSEAQVLLGHLGDSKAILCSLPTSNKTPPAHTHQQHTTVGGDSGLQHRLQAAALTHDHSPDRPDELARITAAGGFVSKATAGDVQSGMLWLSNSSLPCFIVSLTTCMTLVTRHSLMMLLETKQLVACHELSAYRTFGLGSVLQHALLC